MRKQFRETRAGKNSETCLAIVIIPRRRLGYREVNRTLDELVDHSRLLTQEHPTSTTGVHNSVFMFAGNLLWRSALSFATRQAIQYFATQSAKLPREEQS